ncbi:hypothetical protein FB565_003005 [Actinoplanes lutulentus]|uniref:Uncharacterized protein n=1 Tax=Actinoplanes lutulentus TaxID=1287878 RepID=A0A327Z9Z7_9ACTN|nr:hypothetical protein [Actinoplanes lutulentus]MBB2943292.1 hypothetical protein [Actinoplanes lutulentus]RAK28351.1 hypothetical protein B0I29_120119 [Actinoplanes lutulentus]
MDDFQPGYPIDLRSDGMRGRDARRYEGDFEYLAARVIARLTGERVVIQDDNSIQSMADVRIEYGDRPTAFVEIVSDVDPDYAQLHQLVFRGQEMGSPSLGRIWYVTVSKLAKLKSLKPALEAFLRRLEDAGVFLELVQPDGSLAQSPVEELRQLNGLGVVQLCSRLPQPDEEPKILLYPQGVGGLAEQDWQTFITWLAGFLSAPGQADVRKKLEQTGAVERHAFVGESPRVP